MAATETVENQSLNQSEDSDGNLCVNGSSIVDGNESLLFMSPRAADTADADSEGSEDVVAEFMANIDPCSVHPDFLPLPSASPLTSLGVACACGCSFEAQAMPASNTSLQAGLRVREGRRMWNRVLDGRAFDGLLVGCVGWKVRTCFWRAEGTVRVFKRIGAHTFDCGVCPVCPPRPAIVPPSQLGREVMSGEEEWLSLSCLMSKLTLQLDRKTAHFNDCCAHSRSLHNSSPKTDIPPEL
ncbi:hypothetical protein BLNAU_21147 [Blattamonas nauphoetae]|uniref:Uncharacterized protein n=1 Tax=Blattamonas nauphoetae TaxID=2049346 RepID=A0ABQ9WXT6_9EUKA|nr:hypothetical protein BLNAU_21147 [Blattamonas nauphoetae]